MIEKISPFRVALYRFTVERNVIVHESSLAELSLFPAVSTRRSVVRFEPIGDELGSIYVSSRFYCIGLASHGRR